MARPKAEDPAHAGRLLLNTNFYATSEYPRKAVGKVKGWKQKVQAVATSAPIQILKSYFSDECLFHAKVRHFLDTIFIF